ncbi:MAG: bifunctional aspartate kinase/homoserine dehydrogenase I, partial [Bacteroidaceae bacterium]|nr:bifunctional aspartate kinase/homoserine dehydrogenase I [Bacteroidaceae bacterium]
MKVMKFGGTSVGSVNSILNVKKIVEAEKEAVIVVVSALGGVTDKLIATSHMAANGDSAYEVAMAEIKRRHIDMTEELIPDGSQKENLLLIANQLLTELGGIYKGLYLIRDLSAKTLATVVSYGERISSRIVTTL